MCFLLWKYLALEQQQLLQANHQLRYLTTQDLRLKITNAIRSRNPPKRRVSAAEDKTRQRTAIFSKLSIECATISFRSGNIRCSLSLSGGGTVFRYLIVLEKTEAFLARMRLVFNGRPGTKASTRCACGNDQEGVPTEKQTIIKCSSALPQTGTCGLRFEKARKKRNTSGSDSRRKWEEIFRYR